MINEIKLTHTNTNNVTSVTIISPLRIGFEEVTAKFLNYLKTIGKTSIELSQVELLFISSKEDIIFGTATCRQNRAIITTVSEIFTIKRESDNLLRLMEVSRNIISDIS